MMKQTNKQKKPKKTPDQTKTNKQNLRKEKKRKKEKRMRRTVPENSIGAKNYLIHIMNNKEKRKRKKMPLFPRTPKGQINKTILNTTKATQ